MWVTSRPHEQQLGGGSLQAWLHPARPVLINQRWFHSAAQQQCPRHECWFQQLLCRCHPPCRSIGYYEQAHKLMADLKNLIDAHESAVGPDYEARLSAQHQARKRLDELFGFEGGEDWQEGSGVGQPGSESSKGRD
jgi:hypothetical protein